MLKPRDVSLVNDILKLCSRHNCDIINFKKSGKLVV